MAPDPCPPPERLNRLLTADLSATELTSLDAHLSGCPGCRATLDALTDLTAVVGPGLAAPPPVARPEALPALPGFETQRLLGRGGMGAVYLAWDQAAGRAVAVKLLREGLAATDAERSRLRADAAALARLSHPNVVTLFAVGGHAGHPYLVMEYLPGGTLAAARRWEPREAAVALAAVADGVQHAHDRGILHRDLKPSNVLLAADGTPKVADFGMGKGVPAGGDSTPTGAAIGTPAYMAPELALGRHKSAGPAADVYGLGAVGYELLTGRPPFQGATPFDTLLQVRDQPPPAPRSLRHDLPRDLETVLLKCLEKDPDGRYPSAAALADDLRRFVAGRPVRARPVGAVGHARRWAGRHPAVAGLLGLLAVVTLGGVIGLTALWRRSDADRATAVRRLDTTRQALAAYMAQAERRFWNPRTVTPEERAELERGFTLQAQLAADYPDDPAARFAAGYAMLQIADITGRLGDMTGALGKSRQARGVIQQASADAPGERWFRAGLGEAFASEAQWVVGTGGGPADDLHRQALRLARELVAEEPARHHYRGLLASFNTTWAARLRSQGRPGEAVPLLVEARDSTRALVVEYPSDPWRRTALSETLRQLAAATARVDRGPDRTEAALREAVEHLEVARAGYPDRPLVFATLLSTRYALGCLLSNSGRPADGRSEFERTAVLTAELARDHPDHPQFVSAHRSLVRTLAALSGRVDPPRAMAELDGLIDASQRNGQASEPRTWLERAEARLLAGDKTGARADLDAGTAAARANWLTDPETWAWHDRAWRSITGSDPPPRLHEPYPP